MVDRELTARWYPVASDDDLPARHVFAGQLAGHELAIWRADDGTLNIWEDRCVHRGVRLSIGINDGAELMCQYHGWRYANRTGGCTYIPAHPADAPAQTICVRSFPARRLYGLVWSTVTGGHADPPRIDVLEGADVVMLRSLPFDATPEHVLERLAEHSFAPTRLITSVTQPVMTAEPIDELGMILTATADDQTSTAVFFVQPLDADRAVVRPVLVTHANNGSDRIGVDVLIHHAHALDDLRAIVESEARGRRRPAKLSPAFEPLSELVSAPSDLRRAPLRVQIASKHTTAAGILAIELVPVGDTLPTFLAGAHIDVHLANGLVRQYSLTNGPGETGSYVIGVKLAEHSTGGSAWLHEHARIGDVLAISEPHNNFTLRRDAVRTILIAGGIGITPLLAMAKTIARSGLDWTLHYFAQGEEHVAFRSDLDRLGEGVEFHLRLDSRGTVAELERILAAPAEFTHVYICGPPPMLDAARHIAAASGWADGHVHFEYFENTKLLSDTSEFEISLARSALTLSVHAGETILEVLRANGVAIPSSCERGACGTCIVRLIDGEPDHQDVYMSNAEHAAADRITTCVSRSHGERLILDI